MTDRLLDWLALVDAQYPERDAEGWDATGLQVGDPADAVTGVLVCLDVTSATLDEATAAEADLVIAHHPLLFRPLARLSSDTPSGRLALRAARAGISVVAVHTNLDVAVPGTTEPTLEALGVTATEPLDPRAGPGTVKLTTFVPREDTAAVVAALSRAGAGVIGEYDQCSFRVAGTGTFRPSPQANPTIGEREALTEVAEDRVEMELPRSLLARVVDALWEAHPYEEVAYDVYPLLDPAPAAKGLGRIGDLAETVTLREVADRLATGLPAPDLRVAGDLDAPVRRVAACGGAGDSHIALARAAGADLYITGDLRHHPTLDGLTMGMALIDAGHYATEAPAMPAVAEGLRRAAGSRGLTAPVHTSTVSTAPWAAYTPPDPTSAATRRRKEHP